MKIIPSNSNKLETAPGFTRQLAVDMDRKSSVGSRLGVLFENTKTEVGNDPGFFVRNWLSQVPPLIPPLMKIFCI